MNIAIVNCFDTYEHRVDLLHEFFIARGDCVKIFMSDFRHFEKVKRTEAKKDFIFLNTKPYYKNISPQRIFSHHKLSKDIFKKLETENIDVLWVLIPPNSFVKQAAKYKLKHKNVKLIFDVIDMWPETMPVEKFEKTFPVKMWKQLRNKYIKCADYVVTECNLYQNTLNKIIDSKKMSTLYLARKIEAFQSNPELPKDSISLCYLGSINNIIDISAISFIISELKKIKPIILHIIGDGEKRDELISTAKAAGANVLYHGKVYDKAEKQKIFDSCYFGLNIMKNNVCVGLTMKSMDYFEASLPIINNIKGDTWDLVNEFHLGFNIDDINNIDFNSIKREQIRKFFENELSVQKFNSDVEIILNKNNIN